MPVMNSNYPSILFELYDYLNECNFELSGGNHDDGRIVSIEKEKDVIEKIQQRFDCITPPPRHWYDIALKMNDEIIYCNIKISKGSTDNAMQKKAIVHSFTNMHHKNIKANMNFNEMLRTINEHQIETRNYNREYYYVYIDKKDKTIIIRSIFDITHFQSNPCNYLQINWNKEKDVDDMEYIDDITEIKKKILGTIAKSLKTFIDHNSKLVEYYYNLSTTHHKQNTLE